MPELGWAPSRRPLPAAARRIFAHCMTGIRSISSLYGRNPVVSVAGSIRLRLDEESKREGRVLRERKGQDRYLEEADGSAGEAGLGLGERK